MKWLIRLYRWMDGDRWPIKTILLDKNEIKLTSGWLAEHEYEESLVDKKIDFAPWNYKVYSKGKIVKSGSFGKPLEKTALPSTSVGLRKGSALSSQDSPGVYPEIAQTKVA